MRDSLLCTETAWGIWQAEHNSLGWNVARRAEVKPNSKCNHDLEWSLLKIAQHAHRRMAVLGSGITITGWLHPTRFREEDIGK